MQFNNSLLDTTRGELAAPYELYAALNARGLYNSLHFVLRLSPVVQQKLAEFSSGFAIRSDVDFEGVQAMSTLLHETVHWWQHIVLSCGREPERERKPAELGYNVP